MVEIILFEVPAILSLSVSQPTIPEGGFVKILISMVIGLTFFTTLFANAKTQKAVLRSPAAQSCATKAKNGVTQAGLLLWSARNDLSDSALSTDNPYMRFSDLCGVKASEIDRMIDCVKNESEFKTSDATRLNSLKEQLVEQKGQLQSLCGQFVDGVKKLRTKISSSTEEMFRLNGEDPGH